MRFAKIFPFVKGDKARQLTIMSLLGTVEMRLALRKLLILCTKAQANGVRTVCWMKHLKKTSENQGFRASLLSANPVPVAINFAESKTFI